LHPLVEAFQGAGSGGSQLDQVSAAVVLIAHARDEAVTFEVAEHGMHVAAVDRQASSECCLACRSLLGKGGHHDEVLPTSPLGGERLGNEAGSRR
jgi:hypothetical protein